jgi:TRAP-type C4-dicarboxylate transport system permease small subunit
MPSARLRARVVRIVGAIDRGLAAIEKVVIVVLLTALTVAVLFQVLSRHLFQEPNPWTEETARYLFVWVSMIGAALAIHLRSHFGLDIVVRRLPPRAQLAAEAVALVVVLITAAVFAVQGVRFVLMNSLMTAPATDISMFWPNAAIPVGMAAMVVHLVLGFVRDLAAERPGG